MATIIANRKNGRIISYRFRAYLGRNEFGEQIARYTTWHIPEWLTPSKAAKAAEKAALAWERQIKETYKNAAADSNGVSSRQDKKIEFSNFVLNTWFPLFIENGEHKPTTVSFYRYTVNRLVTHFRGRTIQDISTIEIKKYLAYLRKDYRTKQGKPLSDITIRHTYCVLVLMFEFAAEEKYVTQEKDLNTKILVRITLLRHVWFISVEKFILNEEALHDPLPFIEKIFNYTERGKKETNINERTASRIVSEVLFPQFTEKKIEP